MLLDDNDHEVPLLHLSQISVLSLHILLAFKMSLYICPTSLAYILIVNRLFG